uniref:Leucine-rich repeat domain-containing protein n=1 Tax=viral metagenome TaxID=1070528 RepID=A0A6C0DRB9_9ZZZZ
MSIITELREDVFKNNNTAQQTLLAILDRISNSSKPSEQKQGESDMEYMQRLNREHNTQKAFVESHHKYSSVFEFSEIFHGDLDLSVLAERGFRNIKTIIFSEGKITSLRGLPESITKLVCPNNLLIHLDNIPDSIEHLDVRNNHLKTLALSKKNKLTYLNIAHNTFEELELLPKSLTELQCNNNKIKFIYFSNNVNMKVVNVSNNPITIIDNLPEDLREFTMDNTPSIEFRNSGNIPIHNIATVNEENDIRQSIHYIEALNLYFQLKTQYEDQFRSAKRKAFQTSKSKKQGKLRAVSIKPKCVNCKRAVGSVFNKTDKHYTAICGDSVSPCNLKIDLFTGYYSSLQDTMYVFKEIQDQLKDTIITQKLDALMNYVDENVAVKDFKENMHKYSEDSSFVKELMDKYDDLHNNPNKEAEILKYRTKIFLVRDKLKQLIEEYESTENREILTTAVQLQKDEYIPAVEILSRLISEHIEINAAISANSPTIYYLFKNDVALIKNNLLIGEPPRVVHFIRSARGVVL